MKRLLALLALVATPIAAQVPHTANFVSGQTITAAAVNTAINGVADAAQPAISTLTAASSALGSDRLACLRSGSYVSCTVAQIVANATGGGSGGLQAANNLSDLASASAARTNIGLGSIATQAASAVAITGGSVRGITDLAIADGGTGAGDAATARGNLGLGSIATQAASAVAITGGSITGITDLALADGGTGAGTASGARTNLGLGTAAVANTGTSGGNVPLLNGANTWTTNQVFGANITASAVNITAGTGSPEILYFQSNGIRRWALATNATTESGSNVGSDFAITNYDDSGTSLGTLMTITRSSGLMTYRANIATTGTIVPGTPIALANGGTGAADAPTARGNLGLGTMATQAASGVAITGGSIAGITDLAVADGGTGGSTAAAARTNLGAAASGPNADITNMTGLTTPLSVAQGGTGASTAAAALTSIGAAASGPNADITALNGLTAKVAFTPTIAFATAGDLSVSYATQTGYYYRVGKMVFIYINLTFTPTFTTASGNLRLTGLPSAADAAVASNFTVQAYYPAAYPGATGTLMSAQVPVGSSSITMWGSKSGSAPTPASTTQFTSGSAQTITISGWYLGA